MAASVLSLSELVAKLKAASEGSRKLDGAIGAAVRFSGDFSISALLHPDRAEFENMEDGTVKVWAVGEDEVLRSVSRGPAPHYTTSIDAAVLLVPTGKWWKVEQFAGATGSDKDAFNAHVVHHDREHDYGVATTAPLALCIAALKARGA